MTRDSFVTLIVRSAMSCCFGYTASISVPEWCVEICVHLTELFTSLISCSINHRSSPAVTRSVSPVTASTRYECFQRLQTTT